ncbi:tRNA(His) 5'-end guanylyltransferase [Methanococcoides vulcani]|uniref:tRNA(His) guanylyltransferase n=1 Tax=Methanococcoides vulcani TaxID=1353158 RepID=A0A1H9Y3D3_9EURY|nr:tRNA(His) guanylyltransferase Thg1 family protein [Methanococcoides vulcani]SES62843.1 tRNA(His) 5'-end guanylyltransferase [Methanococcoides vulcani]
MKQREIYSDLRCIPPVIIRVDGRTFKHTLSRLGCEKPYDERFASAMADSLELFFKKSGMSAALAYTFSDEASILFFDLPFDGRVEKLDSVVASYLSSAFTIKMGLDEPVSFDSRIIPIEKGQVPEYLVWRQDEAWRNCVSSYGYYTLRSEGLSEREAAAAIKGKKAQDIHEMLFQRGINLDKVPAWQKRGVVIHKTEYHKTGFDPVKNERTRSKRSKVVQDWDIPMFSSDDGTDFLKKYIMGH